MTAHRGSVGRAFTSSLLSEKFTWQVPIFGLVPLNLACGYSLQDLILKNHNFRTLASRLSQV